MPTGELARFLMLSEDVCWCVMQIEEGKMLDVLQQYQTRLPDSQAFVAEIERLLHTLTKAAGVAIVSITSRVKTHDSLKRKFLKTDRAYSALDDITDLCGTRVITYFAQDVDVVAKIIRAEFEIDWQNSVDKRADGEPDRFGYASLHYIAKLNNIRSALTENQRFGNCKCELQIRSILQHAWAEIEHDLGYKSELELPRQFRRQFSRLAGLLELADEEFDSIRTGLSGYLQTLSAEIKERPEGVLIDSAAIKRLLETDDEIRAMERAFGCSAPESVESGTIPLLVQLALALKLDTIGKIQRAFRECGPKLANIGPELARIPGREPLAGLSVYWAFIVTAKLRGLFTELLRTLGVRREEERFDQLSTSLNHVLVKAGF